VIVLDPWGNILRSEKINLVVVDSSVCGETEAMSNLRFTKPKLALARELILAFFISSLAFSTALTHWYQFIRPPAENELVKIAIWEGRSPDALLKEQETPDDVQNVARSVIAAHALFFVLPVVCIAAGRLKRPKLLRVGWPIIISSFVLSLIGL
jgi:hypothetical protein